MINQDSVINFKHSKTAVLTGGTGYIGSRVVNVLVNQGWDVVMLVRPEKDYSKYETIQNPSLIKYDGCAESLVKLESLNRDTTVFIHIASSFGINHEIENSAEIVATNVRLGTELCAFMVKHRFKRLILTESYWQFDEHGVMGGNSLYAASKSAFSLIAEYFTESDLSVLALVLYDVYGPNDHRGKLINNLINAASVDLPFPLTDGEQIIDFVHVDDVAQAYATAARRILTMPFNASFNRYTVRSMRALTLREYVGLLEKIIKRKITAHWGAKPYPRNQIMKPWLPYADSQLIGWAPIISFEEGIAGLIHDD